MTTSLSDHPLRAPLAWLALAELEGVGPVEGLKRARAWIGSGAERPPLCTPSAWELALSKAQHHLTRAEALGVQVVSYACEGYPPLLRLTPRAPLALYLKGKPPQTRPQLAIVGTRQPTAWGLEVAQEAASVAVSLGVGVTSGLALGIDQAAHQACLKGNGETWAVLGSGLAQVSPMSARPLAEAILSRGGGLISELPPDEPVRPHQLVARNRLQSGLSLATLVVETGIKGGSIHTARFTLAQGRALWVPEPPVEGLLPQRKGLRVLQREGALMISGAGVLREVLSERLGALEGLEQRGREALEWLWLPVQGCLL